MVNGLHLYCAFLTCGHSKHFAGNALRSHMHSYTHSYTEGGVDHTRPEPAGQEQLGVMCLGQEHLDTPGPRGSNQQSSGC